MGSLKVEGRSLKNVENVIFVTLLSFHDPLYSYVYMCSIEPQLILCSDHLLRTALCSWRECRGRIASCA